MNTIGLTMLLALAPGLVLAAPACEVRSGPHSRPLLELYTSEGCSSCPPADRWFSSLGASAAARDSSLLSFHVDYWDELGWPDRFARHAYTTRQQARVRAAGSATIYTPQVMLSSRRDLRWYKPGDVATVLAEVAREPARGALHLRALPSAQGWRVELDASSLDGGKSDLYLALYENGLVSSVKAGENAGSVLRHDRVVRGLWGPWRVGSHGTQQRLQVRPPVDGRTAALGLTAFLENPDSGEGLQSLSLPLADCSSLAARPAKL